MQKKKFNWNRIHHAEIPQKSTDIFLQDPFTTCHSCLRWTLALWSRTVLHIKTFTLYFGTCKLRLLPLIDDGILPVIIVIISVMLIYIITSTKNISWKKSGKIAWWIYGMYRNVSKFMLFQIFWIYVSLCEFFWIYLNLCKYLFRSLKHYNQMIRKHSTKQNWFDMNNRIYRI